MLVVRETSKSQRSTRGLATPSGQYDAVVIGGGPGGYVAAIKAAQLTACIEKRGTLGGTCLNAMLNNSHIHHQSLHDSMISRSAVSMVRVKLNLQQMLKAKEDSVDGIEILFEQNKVDYIKGATSFVSPNIVSVQLNDGGESTVEARDVIIATGSEIVSSTGVLSLQKVPEKVVVIGGGIVGLEMASVWSRLGTEGLKFQLSTKVLSAERVVVATEAARDEKQDSADVVLVAVGRRPYIQGLGVENVGVEIDSRWRIEVRRGPRVSEEREPADHIFYVAQLEFLLRFADSRHLGDRVKFLVEAETVRILGVHIIGPNGGEVIAEGVLALEYGASVENISRTTHAHPTPSEAFGETALQVSSGNAIHF
ncbi:dihydrolipoyl dehydrogenase [Lactarius hengduanensis]|nr:dihydrolipoyl dehydrogenase [Lactarius hengduanensis]